MALEAAGFENGQDLLFEIDGTILSGGGVDNEGCGEGGEDVLGFHGVSGRECCSLRLNWSSARKLDFDDETVWFTVARGDGAAAGVDAGFNDGESEPGAAGLPIAAGIDPVKGIK